MRNRILQKTFWTSEEILELELHERLLFLGMTNYADDEGIIKTSPKALKAKIFPADNISIEKLEKALLKMRGLGLIAFNIDGTLCRFVSWHDHQKINRPYPSKFNFVEENNDDSVNVHGTLTHHSSPNNNNNSNNKNNNKNNNKTNQYSNEFESFWKSYPRKVAKRKCYNKFNDLIKQYSLEDIFIGVDLRIDYWKKTRKEVEFIPHPYTFLSQERFIDLPDEIENQLDVEYRLDTTGHYIGYCSGCKSSSFYKEKELKQDSRCCNKKILPQRESIEIQDINAKA